MHKLWLLKLIFPWPYGRLLTCFVLLCVLLPVFYLGHSDNIDSTTPALFYSLTIAYIIPIFSYITAKSQEALLELRPLLDLEDGAFEKLRAHLDSTSLSMAALQMGAGAVLGVIHMSLIRGSVSDVFTTALASRPGFVSTLGAIAVWIVMTTVISMLIKQAILFARLGAYHVQVTLLDTSRLLPFARVSISASLAIIGALALFPLIGIESGMNLMEVLPGAIATLVPLLAIFVVPVWPIHRRLAVMKERHLASLNERIETRLGAGGGFIPGTEVLEDLAPLLVYRREIAQVSTWPFDGSNVTRMTFYLIIPPLTWAGAALIENLVDWLL
jgi:hypothetical protein